MKNNYAALVFSAVFTLLSCGESLTDSRYAVELPELPPAWRALLGSPYWRVEWINSEGKKEAATVRDAGLEVSLLPTLASAVSAMPFWPDKGIKPGIFKPAGAIFPFDVSGKNIVLSWQGGVDANLFWEFVNAVGEARQESVL
ncbi:MAG: hypothetical protein FWC24_04455, partial [Treponema sp.]|nr:hypothetical protein [Treponema sp.]